MTLNGEMALILRYCSKFGIFAGALHALYKMRPIATSE